MRTSVKIALPGWLALALLAGAGCQSTQPAPVLSSTSLAPTGHAWREGEVGLDAAGRAAVFCRTESGQFLALSTGGHPLYGSQGDREHTARYLAGANPWSASFEPVSTLGNLWALSDQATNKLDYGQFGLAAMVRAVGRSGSDKRKHFEVCYASIQLSGEGEDVFEDLLLAPVTTLALGIEKELNDRNIPPARREALHAALERTRAEMRTVLDEISRLRLDRGDLVADIAGYSYGNAVKGTRWLQFDMP